MKHFKYCLTLGIITIILSSCAEFLNEKPQGTANSGNYLNDPSTATLACNAAYDALVSMLDGGPSPNVPEWMGFSYEFELGDESTDDSDIGPVGNGLYDLQDWTITPGWIGHTNWDARFVGLARANYLINGLPGSTLKEDLRERLLGEAYFLRSFFNWSLVRHYGKIPIVLASDNTKSKKRSPINEVYARIREDLEAAIARLPERSKYASNDMGRATKGAAKSLLARVLMYQVGTDKDVADQAALWKEVYRLTDEVIKSNEYDLLKNYAELWEEGTGDNSVEGVFEFQCVENGQANPPEASGTNYYQAQNNPHGTVPGWGFNTPTSNLYAAFDIDNTNDPRLSCIVYGPAFNGGVLYGRDSEVYDRNSMTTNFFNRKAAFKKSPPFPSSAPRNIKCIRYADVILMHAEAGYYTGQGDPVSDLKRIQDRVKTSSYCMGYTSRKQDEYTPLSKPVNFEPIPSGGQALLETIWKERRLEFAMESLRFFDLVRTGRFVDQMETVRDFGRDPSVGVVLDPLERRSVNVRANILQHSFDGPNGHKVPVWPIPSEELIYLEHEQNPGYN